MKIVIISLISLLLIVVIVFFTNITISIKYNYSKNDNNISISFKTLFGLINYCPQLNMQKLSNEYSSDIPSQKIQKVKPVTKKVKQTPLDSFFSEIQTVKHVISELASLHKPLRYFFNKVNVRKLTWKSTVGINDAASTGTLTGLCWMVKGWFIGGLGHFFNFKNSPEVIITPSFQQTAFETQFVCIVKFRIGYAILTSIKLLKQWKNIVKYFEVSPINEHVKVNS